MKILTLSLAIFMLCSCETAPTDKGTYAQRRAQMCADKPAFCVKPCSKIEKTESGKFVLTCN